MKQFWNDLGSKLGIGLCGAGILLVFLGWNGAASVDRVEAQFPYLISGGMAGLSLVVLGVGLIVVQNQRADRAELQATLRELSATLSGASDAPDFHLPTPRPTPEEYAVALQPSRSVPAPTTTPTTETDTDTDTDTDTEDDPTTGGKRRRQLRAGDA